MSLTNRRWQIATNDVCKAPQRAMSSYLGSQFGKSPSSLTTPHSNVGIVILLIIALLLFQFRVITFASIYEILFDSCLVESFRKTYIALCAVVEEASFSKAVILVPHAETIRPKSIIYI